MDFYEYPAKIEPNDEGGYIASFRDVPEALTEARTMEELKNNARDALITAIDFYFEKSKTFPCASAQQPGETNVVLPASVVLKIMLLNSMLTSHTRPADLARKMNVRPQEVTRIIDIHHATKIDTLEKAFKALGKQLCFELK